MHTHPYAAHNTHTHHLHTHTHTHIQSHVHTVLCLQGGHLDNDSIEDDGVHNVSEPRMIDFVRECIASASGQAIPLLIGLERLKLQMPGFQVICILCVFVSLRVCCVSVYVYVYDYVFCVVLVLDVHHGRPAGGGFYGVHVCA
jgi:hypothetical protein